MVRLVIEVLNVKGRQAVEQHEKEVRQMSAEAQRHWRNICSEEWFNNWFIMDLQDRYNWKGNFYSVQHAKIIKSMRKTMKKNGAVQWLDYEIFIEEGF